MNDRKVSNSSVLFAASKICGAIIVAPCGPGHRLRATALVIRSLAEA